MNQDQIKEFQDAFNGFAIDGRIASHQLESVMNSLGYKACKVEDIESLDFNQFLQIMKVKLKESEQNLEIDLINAFKALDKYKNNGVMPINDCQALLQEQSDIVIDNNDTITVEEFVKFCIKKYQ